MIIRVRFRDQPGWKGLLLLGLPAVALLGIRLGGQGPGKAAAPAPPSAGAVASGVRDDPGGSFEPRRLDLQMASLGHGTTLSAAFDRLGLDAETVRSSLAALGELLDLRRLPAETGIAVGRGPAGAVRVVGIRAEPDRFVRLRLPEGGEPPSAENVWVPTLTRVSSAGGVVSSSVAQALAGAPLGPQLTLAFANIFQWDVDLLVDPRAGDTVQVVFETLEVGPPPEDLPPFDDRVEGKGDVLGLGRILAASYDGHRVRSRAYWVERQDGGDYYDEQGAPLEKTFLQSPLNYRRVSSHFSRARRHPITRQIVPHHGVDFAAPAGTPVVATADGRVAAAGWDGALGRALRLRHGSTYVTIYGHLSGFARGIRSGVEVRQNQVIGYVGSTGRATGPHLHYTLIDSGRPVDPLHFDNPHGEPLPAELLPRLNEAMRAWSPLLALVRPFPSDLAAADAPGSASVLDWTAATQGTPSAAGFTLSPGHPLSLDPGP